MSEVPQAMSVLQGSVNASAREQAQAYLLQVQRSQDLTWPQISHWLSSSDKALQIYAGQCLQIRFARFLAVGLSQDEKEEWVATGFTALDALLAGSLSLSEAPRQKFLQAMTSMILMGFPQQVPNPIDDLIARIQKGFTNPSALRVLLELLALIPEELNRMQSNPDHRYKWLHQMKGAYDPVTLILSQISMDPNVSCPELVKAKLSCLTAWIKYGLPLDKVRGEINLSLQLPMQSFMEPVIEMLTEIAGLLNLERSQTLSLLPIVLSFKDHITSDVEEAQRDACRLFTTFCETHSDDLFNALMKGSNAAHEFLVVYLSITGAPGTFIIDEHVSGSSLTAWCLLHDLAIDFGLPAGTLVKDLFSELARTLLRKATLPEDDEWASLPRDLKAEHEQYRRDIADALLYCWRILGDDLYAILADDLAPGTCWRLIEARLFAFMAISEEVEETNPAITALLQSLPSFAQHPRNRVHAIRLFGCFAHHRIMSDETIGLLIEEVKQGTLETALEAVRSLHQINEEAPEALVKRYGDLVGILSGARGMGQQVGALLCKTIGCALSELQVDKLVALSQAIEVLHSQSNADLITSLLISLIKSVQLKDNELSEMELSKCNGLALLFDHVRLNLQGDKNGQICELFESLALTCSDGSFNMATPGIEVLYHLLKISAVPHFVNLTTTLLCVYGPHRPDLTKFFVASLIEVQPAWDDEDLHEAFLNLLSKAAGTCLNGLAQCPIKRPLQWSLERLIQPALSTPLLRAIVKLHVSLLTNTNQACAHSVENIYSQYGPALIQNSLYAASNTLSRSQLDTVARLLFELYHRFPGPSANWMHTILQGIPGLDLAKANFKKGMAGCRSLGKAKQVFADFINAQN